MNFLVVGCGRVGAELAFRLFKGGHQLTGKFGLQAGALLFDVTQKLGVKSTPRELLAACIGRKLEIGDGREVS